MQARQVERFGHHPAFPDLTLLDARFTTHRYALHTHPGYVVALITSGCERVRIGRQQVIAPAGSVLVVSPEEWHDGEAATEEGWSYRTCYPSTVLLGSIMAELGQDGLPEFPNPVIQDPHLAGALDAAHAAARRRDALHAETTMLEALRHLVMRHGATRRRVEAVEDSGRRRRLAAYAQVIADDLAGTLSLQRLADAGGVTRFQVIRDFRRELGLTPATFIRDRRLRRARALLENGARLSEAAFAAGFADQSHLSRAFSATHGVSPGAFQRVWKDRVETR